VNAVGRPDATAHVAVCGGGLIGASLALALAGRGRQVRVHDRDAQVRAELSDVLRGVAGTCRVDETWASAATGAGVVVAAVPPPAIPGVIAEAAPLALPGALLTDVAGVKRNVVDDVRRALAASGAAQASFVGGHPMAGSERSGPQAADAMLFSGATWVLTPTADTADGALAEAGDLVRDLGARVLVLAPEEHDTIVGLVSHLPQLVASVLADVAAEAVGSDRDAVMAVAGPGFRDTTRIAASDAALWLDIIDGNREAIASALEAFGERLDVVRAAVVGRDAGTLDAVLRRASEARRRLVPKGLDAPTRDLVVPLRDRPGEIARIAGSLGSAGINIEDLAMRHASAADRGSLLLRVRADVAERALGVLAGEDIDAVLEPDAAGDAGTPGTGAEMRG
jgi:prephenate dehydrogenase